MAEGGRRPAGQHRRHPTTSLAHQRTADGKDFPADQVQTTAGEAPLDRLIAESQLPQLPPRHNPMLRGHQSPNLGRLLLRAPHEGVNAALGPGSPLGELVGGDYAALVGADADRAVGLGHFDVEAELAAFYDLAELCADATG
jgi:hypothetical protein